MDVSGRISRSRSWLPLAILVLGSGISMFVLFGMQAREAEYSKSAANDLARESLGSIAEILAQESSAMHRMAERWILAEGMAQNLWERDAASYLRDFDSLDSVVWNDGDHIIRWAQNRHGRRDAINFDLKKIPERVDRLRELMRSRQWASSGPLELRNGTPGFVYDIPLLGADERFMGFLHGVFNYRILLTQSLESIAARTYPWEKPRAELYINGRRILGADAGQESPLGGVSKRKILGENWELRITLPRAHFADERTAWPWIVASLLLALTVFLAMAFYFRQTSINDAIAARVAEERLEEAINALDTPFAYFDHEDRLRIWNEAYEEMHSGIADLIAPGVTYEVLLRALVDRGHARNAIGHEEQYVQERLRLHGEGDFRGERQLSNDRWVTSRKIRTNDGGVAAIWTDITRLKEQQAELIQARNTAERASSAKSEFLANISHELRTPLNAINGFSELIYKELFGPVSEKYRDYARDINSSGKLLLSLIDDVLDLSKIEAGALKLEEEKFKASRLFESVKRLVEGRGEEKGVTIHWPDPATDIVIHADFRMLLQVMVNLTTNAVKFTPSGGEIRIDADLNDDVLRLSVSDTGIGMTQSEISDAMQPFVQVGAGSALNAQGTGLGLPLVQKFVELHGGNISIASTPQKGTTVTIRLTGRASLRDDEAERKNHQIGS